MRKCPECKQKIGFRELFKSLFHTNNAISCRHCQTELTIRIGAITRGIINGISTFLGILVGVYFYGYLDYTVIGAVAVFILAFSFALIINVFLMFIIISILGFKKKEMKEINNV